MPIQDQQHSLSRQELIRAIEEVDTKPNQVQLILKNHSKLIQEYGDDLLTIVMRRCDITTSAGSECKLLTLNIYWKVLLSILTNSHVSQSVYEMGASFMLDQLHHGVFSHNWTDSKMIKLATFFASHIVFTAKAHPKYFLCASEYALVRRVVCLFVSISFTIASSELDDDNLRPLFDNVLLRLKTLLEYLGSASITMEEGTSEYSLSGVTIKEIDAVASFNNRRYVDLLYQCISEVDVAEMMEAAGGDSSFVSMVVATASLACFLSTACGLLQKLTLTHTAVPRRCPQLLLSALIQWMPSVSLDLQESLLKTEDPKVSYGTSCSLKTSLASIPSHFDQKEMCLLSRIKELADYLPLSALWQTNCSHLENTADSFCVKRDHTGTLREQWVHRAMEVLYIALPNSDQIDSVEEETDNTSFVLTCVLMGLATPYFQNTTLMMEAYLGLFLLMSRVERSQCVGMNQDEPEPGLKDEYCAKHLSMLLQIGLIVFNECSLTVCRKGEHTSEDQRCCYIYRSRLQASLLALIGAESAILTGLPPSALAVRMVPHLRSPLLHIFPSFFSLADYCFFSLTDECGLQNNTQSKTEISIAIKSVNDVFKNLFIDTSSNNQLDRSNLVFLNEECVIALPLALCHLRFALAVEPFNTPTDEKLEQYHSVLSSFQSMFARLTNGIQQIITAINEKPSDVGNVDPIACFLLMSSLLREAAYFPLDASCDKVLVACIRRWVDLSLQLASCSLVQLQPAFSEFLQYHAARSLFFFMECNTYVPIEQLNLSETAATFIMRFLQSQEDKGKQMCFPPHISDGEVNKRFLKAYVQCFEQSREWQTVCNFYNHEQAPDSADCISTDNSGVSTLLASMQQCQASLCRLLREQRDTCEDINNEEVSFLHLTEKQMYSGDNQKLIGSTENSVTNRFRPKEALDLSLRLRELLRVGHIVDTMLFRTARREGNKIVESSNVPSPTGSTNITSSLLSLSVEVISSGHASTQNSLGNTVDIQG
ncbi:unnamed protein product [Phytomonas sp. Hart1]|nr:unnamed protein product [Phytomonas sp. Hart1]|eukprot:CCW70462.1 unnamed protein product [Phytomonas sp. isolate Hart1]